MDRESPASVRNVCPSSSLEEDGLATARIPRSVLFERFMETLCNPSHSSGRRTIKQVAYARYFQRRFIVDPHHFVRIRAPRWIPEGEEPSCTASPSSKSKRSLGLSSAENELVTSIPVFCFRFLHPDFTALILRRIRLNRAVCLGLLM